MKIGEMVMTNKIQHRGFNNRDAKFTMQSKPGSLMVYMYMGAITPESAAHYNPDGVLAAMGYGPIQSTIVQRKTVEALKAAQSRLRDVTDPTAPGIDEALTAQIAEALQLAANFQDAGAPVAGAIMVDASRWDKLVRIAAGKVGGSQMLHALCGTPDIDTQGLDERGCIEAIIDAAELP